MVKPSGLITLLVGAVFAGNMVRTTSHVNHSNTQCHEKYHANHHPVFITSIEKSHNMTDP